jgi:hypothetical protein
VRAAPQVPQVCVCTINGIASTFRCSTQREQVRAVVHEVRVVCTVEQGQASENEMANHEQSYTRYLLRSAQDQWFCLCCSAELRQAPSDRRQS